MSTSLVLRVLWSRKELRSRVHWSEARVHDHQQRALGELRAFALARSRYNQRLYRGLEDAPLGQLPVRQETEGRR